MPRFLRKAALLGCMVLAAVVVSLAAPWRPIGPDGGDARSLAADPRNPDRILLGTSSSQLFVSNDGGYTWSRLARVGDGDHYVVDHIVFNPAHPETIYAAAWSVETDGGDVFRSDDDGRSWHALAGMHGKSVRSFALAPSDPSILVAGALDGVFRSRDAGETWERISPPGHPELKNIESLAIDPHYPEIIYAGTWHLPWKTVDGGLTWSSIKEGVVDDSDVFSIILDPRDSRLLYASACTGIYKSEDAGAHFRKVQGIPNSARRTRVLSQHPLDPNMVYAGTTEGLWATINAGQSWHRVTADSVIVNDVLVDARHPGTVLLATDRSGVLRSENGGAAFFASNRGFAHRQVTAVLVDRNDPSVLYAGVVNDKEYGGLFVSHDAGEHWAQMNDGLAGHDIFSLRQTGEGTLLAGTNRGVFAWGQMDKAWRAMNSLAQEAPAAGGAIVPAPAARTRKREKPHTDDPPAGNELSGRVADLEVSPETWFAATSQGLFSSVDGGQSWRGGAVLGQRNFVAVHAAGQIVVAITPATLVVSRDGGSHWYAPNLPDNIAPLTGVALGSQASIWLASRGGAYGSRDGGETWEHAISGIDALDVTSMMYDSDNRRLLATTVSGAFESADLGRTWHRTGEPTSRLRGISLGGGRLYARTDFDGVVTQKDHILSEDSARSSVPGTGSSN
ncbi:MAG: transcriptional regulator [Terriglobales bacterium]